MCLMYSLWNKLTHYTRLHSSRMRTARALTESPSMLCVAGGVCSRGCLLLGSVCPQEGLLLGGGCSGRCLLQGGSAPAGEGGVVSQHALRQTPPRGQTPVKTLPCPNFVAGGNNNHRVSH